jgi:hypothetical protein
LRFYQNFLLESCLSPEGLSAYIMAWSEVY